MTESNPCHDKLSCAISDMEDQIYEVRRWGDVLIVMSASSHSTQPETLSVLGNVLHELGLALEGRFQRAFDLAHQGSDPQGRQP